MVDLYEPLAPMGSAPPPPPPTYGGGGGVGGPSKEGGKESKVFSDNVTGNTQVSAVNDTELADPTSQQSTQHKSAEKSKKNKKKQKGGSNDDAGRKRSKGGCICMIVSGILGSLSLISAIFGAVALALDF